MSRHRSCSVIHDLTWCHTSARAYYLSSSHDPDNLDRAEASLNELIDTIDTAADHVSEPSVYGSSDVR